MIRKFAHHPTAANLLMLMLLIMGAMTVTQLRRETFPLLPADEIRVQVKYPGALPSDVEDAICRRIEDAIDDVEGIDEVRSEALENLGRVSVDVQEGHDPQVVLDDVRTAMGEIDDFPEEAEVAVVSQLGRTQEVASIAVGGDMSVSDLKHYCEQLKDRMQRRPEISIVDVEGFSQRQLLVEIPALTLLQHGLSADDVAMAIAQQSLDLPAGMLQGQEGDFVVRFVDERRSPAELESLIILGSGSGAEIRLGELATITDTFEQDEEKFLFDGRRAGLLRVRKTADQDALDVVESMQEFIAEENRVAAEGTELVLTQDMSSVVKDRLQMLVTNGIQGMVLVFGALWLFFSFRLAFWVAMTLPVSFLGAFFFMNALGYSLNMISLVALLLALGLLMDDGIVLAENIATHFQKGKSGLRAAVDGTLEVQSGVFSSFLTTIAVFGPISFLSGDLGVILGVLPVVLVTVLVVSLIEAFLILPSHLGHSLRHQEGRPPNAFRRRFDEILEWVRERIVGRLVDRLVRWRYATAGTAVAVFLMALGVPAGGFLKFKAFPALDGDVIQARVLAPQGTPLARTEAIVERIVTAFDRVNLEFRPRQPDEQDLKRHVSVRFSQHADAFEIGAHVATVTVDLLDAGVRDAKLDDVLGLWRDEVGPIPDAISLQFTEPAMGPQGRAIEIRIAADDLAQLEEASRRTQAWLGEYAGVFDVFDDLRPGKPEIDVRLRDGARSLGASAQRIASQMRAAFFGRKASQMQIGSEDYEIDVQLAESDRDGIADLDDFRVVLDGGGLAPIETVAELSRTRGYARIARVDGRRTVTVLGSVDSARANVTELLGRFDEEMVPPLTSDSPGMTFEYKGEAEKGSETGGSMVRGFLIGLIGIFLLLSFQFRSYAEPLVVMTAIPMALIGVVIGHLLFGLDLCLPSIMGFVSLAGIVVNDSILLVVFIKNHRRLGHSVQEAATRAARERFRAVLLTSVTTIAGMVPLMLETSLQAQILIPLAVSVVFGLAASTMLVILLLPATYTILADLGWVEHIEVDAASPAEAGEA